MKKIVFFSIFMLTACGGGGGEGDDDFSSSTKLSMLAGVWDNTEDYGSDGKDEAYLVIDKDGYLSYYDYAGDTFDEWGNCYWIDKNYAQISYLSGTRYRIKDFEVNESGEISLEVRGSRLQVTEADVDDHDDDGNTKENHTFELTKAARKTVADLVPECVDSEAAARALIPAKREKTIPF